MCTYNHEKYIAQAIESVLMQQCEVGYELLIGDDCSNDNTKAIVAEYAEKYPEVVFPVYNERNIGASQNLVKLINKARGEMIAICDGDDYWISNSVIQKQWDILSQNEEYGMVCAKARTYDESTQQFTGVLGSSVAESLESMLSTNQDVAAPTIAFKADLLKKCVAESEWYINNNCFYDTIMAYWFAYYSKIKFLDEELAAYRVLPESACHTKDLAKQEMYQKRYFSVKWRFILEHKLPVDYVHELLLEDYSHTVVNSKYLGEIRVRNSKKYKIGQFISKNI